MDNNQDDLEMDAPLEHVDEPPENTYNTRPCRINVSEPLYGGFFRRLRSVAVPEVAAQFSILEGDLDDAETELKLAKANYKRRYLYISGAVAAAVAILQLSKQWAVNDVTAGMAIDYTSAVITILGTAATGFVKAWDDTADDHLAEIAKSRQTMATVSPV